MHNLTLNPDPAAVDDPQSLEASAMGFLKIFFDDWLDVSRRDAVEVEHVGDGNPDRIFVHAPLLLA